jgi:DNA-directed RNA polymerase subunit alpha
MPHISTLELTQEVGKFVLEPLERGYGQTIGNALRRVMLSSIQGAAVSAVRIDKVFHEFAPIPGVREDTTQLLLNLKDVAIRYTGEDGPPEEDQTLRLDVKGPGRVTGADIVCPEGVEVVNPEAYIATISEKGANLTMEMYVGWGTGYLLPEKQDKYKGIIGVIPTGSQFTPTSWSRRAWGCAPTMSAWCWRSPPTAQ